jgi:hypothetical protein
MERCDCEIWQCLAQSGELPANQKCAEGRTNYCPSMDYDIRPLHFFEYAIAIDAKGG